MSTRELPDVTSDIASDTPLTLKWVGMEAIAVPLSFKLQNNQSQMTNANANVYVSLEQPNVKGIHMSRLHKIINHLADLSCDQESINQLLDDIVASQNGIGSEARIQLSTDLILNKPALLSDESGYQSYPISITAEKTQQGYQYQLDLRVTYSSTCPCSASLARQLYADAVERSFNEDTIDKAELLQWIQSQAGSVATPHSQRSHAYLRMTLADKAWPNIDSLIKNIEEWIGTPVQTAVKRVDEQEFARLNAENLMFCEDAARRIKQGLEAMQIVTDYWFKVEHQESLHAHNAVVIDYMPGTKLA